MAIDFGFSGRVGAREMAVVAGHGENERCAAHHDEECAADILWSNIDRATKLGEHVIQRTDVRVHRPHVASVVGISGSYDHPEQVGVPRGDANVVPDQLPGNVFSGLSVGQLQTFDTQRSKRQEQLVDRGLPQQVFGRKVVRHQSLGGVCSDSYFACRAGLVAIGGEHLNGSIDNRLSGSISLLNP